MRSEIRNPKSKIVTFVWAIIACLPFIAVVGSNASEKLAVYVVNYPLKYFAERIAGEHAKVVFRAPADGDPAYWMPDAKTVSEYQKADLILLNGANYAKWVSKVTLPRSKLVNTSAKFKGMYITAKEVVTHSHGQEGKHAHESLAFTTWIDFDLAAKQAKEIAKALSRKKPALRSTFEANYAVLKKDLLKLDEDIKAIVSKNQSQPLVASHPVYDYFSRRYGLNMRSVHWEPDETPGNRLWMELRAILKNHPARWMIWEGEPDPETVERLKSLVVNSLVFDPCGNAPQKGDFLTVMRKNIENLKPAFP